MAFCSRLLTDKSVGIKGGIPDVKLGIIAPDADGTLIDDTAVLLAAVRGR